MADGDGDEGEASFWLYDLEVEIEAAGDGRPMMGAYRPGDRFRLEGEMLTLPPGQGFSIYALAALLPLLPAKQRATAAADWMTTDEVVVGPDPNCGARYRIRRVGRRRFRHGETTAVPMGGGGEP